MHSCIIQLETSPDVESATTEEMIYGNFVGQIADYVSSGIAHGWPQGGDITKVLTMFDKLNEHEIRLNKASMRDYFWKSLERIKESLEVLKNIYLDDFIEDKYWMEFYKIHSEHNDEYSVYIFTNGERYTLSSWLRAFQKMDNRVWHVGTILDYHY